MLNWLDIDFWWKIYLYRWRFFWRFPPSRSALKSCKLISSLVTPKLTNSRLWGPRTTWREQWSLFAITSILAISHTILLKPHIRWPVFVQQLSSTTIPIRRCMVLTTTPSSFQEGKLKWIFHSNGKRPLLILPKNRLVEEEFAEDILMRLNSRSRWEFRILLSTTST